MTWTAPGAKPARRGGLRGPRRPRVPLLLLAMGPSFSRVMWSARLRPVDGAPVVVSQWWTRGHRVLRRASPRGRPGPAPRAHARGRVACRRRTSSRRPGTGRRRDRRRGRSRRAPSYRPACGRPGRARAWGGRSGTRRSCASGRVAAAAGRDRPAVAGPTTTPPRMPPCVARFGLAAGASAVGLGVAVRRRPTASSAGFAFARVRFAGAAAAASAGAVGRGGRCRGAVRRPRPWPSCARFLAGAALPRARRPSRPSAAASAAASVGDRAATAAAAAGASAAGASRVGGRRRLVAGAGGDAQASAAATSLRMSIRQPVRRAASRAFWPSRPIASESIRSGTVTAAIRCSSSMHDAQDLRRRQRVGDEHRRVLVPRDHVDLLARELGDDGLDPRPALADRGADGVEPLLARRDGDLGAAAGLAGDRLDLDRARRGSPAPRARTGGAGSPCGSG